MPIVTPYTISAAWIVCRLWVITTNWVRALSSRTQFVVITHNRQTIQAAEIVYGVTMGSDSASKVMGLRLSEHEGGLPG